MEHDVSDSFRTATRRAARSIPNTSTNDVRIFLILRITLLKYASQEPQQPQLAPATSGASRPVRLRHRHSIRNRRHDFSPSTGTHSSADKRRTEPQCTATARSFSPSDPLGRSFCRRLYFQSCLVNLGKARDRGHTICLFTAASCGRSTD
jgi:hypothetical protein